MKKIISKFLIASALIVTLISGTTTVENSNNTEVADMIKVQELPDLPSQH